MAVLTDVAGGCVDGSDGVVLDGTSALDGAGVAGVELLVTGCERGAASWVTICDACLGDDAAGFDAVEEEPSAAAFAPSSAQDADVSQLGREVDLPEWRELWLGEILADLAFLSFDACFVAFSDVSALGLGVDSFAVVVVVGASAVGVPEPDLLDEAIAATSSTKPIAASTPHHSRREISKNHPATKTTTVATA